MVDYMLKNNDPRLRMLYRKNNYTKENVDLWNVQNPGKQIVYNPQQYVGGHSNPDAVNVTTSPEYYAAARKIKQADGKELTLDTLSYTQERMFYPSFSNGTGIVWMPGISCADFCFMAAEFVTRGVGSSKTARQWYETGVESSIRLYSEMAGKAQVENYEAVKESEIKAYMQTSAVQWDASQALEKIASQAFIDYYKNVNEAMSLWKRTGFPNTVTPFPVEPLTSEGQQIVIPRRHSFTYPLPGTNNYENYKKRIDDMAKDPDFGEPIDATGRIWWDKK